MPVVQRSFKRAFFQGLVAILRPRKQSVQALGSLRAAWEVAVVHRAVCYRLRPLPPKVPHVNRSAAEYHVQIRRARMPSITAAGRASSSQDALPNRKSLRAISTEKTVQGRSEASAIHVPNAPALDGTAGGLCHRYAPTDSLAGRFVRVGRACERSGCARPCSGSRRPWQAPSPGGMPPARRLRRR